MDIPKHEIMLNSTSAVAALAKPLEQIGINFFSYVRVYKNGCKIDLTNTRDAAECVYYKTSLIETYDPEVAPSLFNKNTLVNSQTFPDNEMLTVLREQYDIDHLLVSVVPHEAYYEIWNFGASVENHSIYDSYLNHLATLTQFKYYFLDKAALLIKEFTKHPFLFKPIFSDFAVSPKEPMNFEHDRYIVDDNILIAKRERECLLYLAQGKSAKEIASILDVSKRTVETYLDRIKIKLNCKRATDLIYQAKKLELI